MLRQLPSRDYLTLKAAFRELVTLCGGVARAATITRGCQSRISEAMSPNHEDRFPALDQIADLEAECGVAAVSRCMASMAGHDMIARPEAVAPATINALLSNAVLEFSDVTANIVRALANNDLSADERHAATAEIDQAINAMYELRAKVATPSLKAVRA